MSAELTVIDNLSSHQPLFREFCKINGLSDGDSYRAVDYLAWCTSLSLQDQLGIIRKYDPGFRFPNCSL